MKGEIYTLSCPQLNKLILGQTNSFALRFSIYHHDLKKRNEKNLNPDLIKDFYKLGAFASFDFHILEIVDDLTKANLERIEQSYIKKFYDSNGQPDQLYKIQYKKTVISPSNELDGVLSPYNSFGGELDNVKHFGSNLVNRNHVKVKDWIKHLISKSVLDKTNYSQFFQPAIYKIVCLKNQCVYIGQTYDFLNRMGDHMVIKQKHENPKLSVDFNKYKLTDFAFQVLEINCSELNLVSYRKKQEKFYLEQVKPELRYNSKNTELKAIQIGQRRFNNAEEVVQKALARCTRTVYNRVRSRFVKFYDWQYVDNDFNKRDRKISIDGSIFYGIKSVIQIGLA